MEQNQKKYYHIYTNAVFLIPAYFFVYDRLETRLKKLKAKSQLLSNFYSINNFLLNSSKSGRVRLSRIKRPNNFLFSLLI